MPLAGVVNLDGPADLKAALPVQQSICGRPAITELIGGPPANAPHFVFIDPKSDIASQVVQSVRQLLSMPRP